MKEEGTPGIRLHIAIGLISASVIAWQAQLVQLLSITQWHHFAYMIISIAMLGFGSAGAFVAVFQSRLAPGRKVFFPLFCFAAAAAMAFVFPVSQHNFVRFDSMLLFTGFRHVFRLAGTSFLLLMPFFFSAVVLGLAFVVYTAESGRVYFSNLVGSGVGGIMITILMWFFLPAVLPALIAILPLAAGFLLIGRKSGAVVGAGAVSALVTIAFIFYPPELKMSQFKGVSRALDLPDAEIVDSDSSPYGFITLVSSPAMRYGPGLSLSYTGDMVSGPVVFVNGEGVGPVVSVPDLKKSSFFGFTVSGLSYVLKPRERVLVLCSGTGMDVAHALINGARHVTAVEPNAALVRFLRGIGQDSVYYDERVEIKTVSPRTYLLSSRERYDLVSLPMIDSFGGSSGLNALSEQYHLTKEAFAEMLLRLDSGGVIAVSTWIDYPYRNPLKTSATIIEALDYTGVKDPVHHIMAVKNWNAITFLVKAEPFTGEELVRAREFCGEMSFDLLIFPGLRENERETYHQLQDRALYTITDGLLESGEERKRIYKEYDFNIKPATDDKPYFSRFFRWKSFGRLKADYGLAGFPFLETGYLVLFVTFAMTLVAAVALIIAPLFRLGWKRGGGLRLKTLVYFSGLGIGYMFVEINFIQKFTLYLGNPVYSVATVAGLMLVSSGVGSFVSQRLRNTRRIAGIIFVSIIVLLVLNALLADWFLRLTIGFPGIVKSLASFLVIVMPAFMMGMPFPMGLRRVAEKSPRDVPWAWGINGCLSVIGASLATIVMVEVGSLFLMLCAAGAYALTAAAACKS